MTPSKFTDAEIESALLAGRLPTANAYVAYRQMKALESIAERLLKLANPVLLAQPFGVETGAPLGPSPLDQGRS